MKMPPVMYEPIFLKGGLDLITPTLNIGPGVVRDSINFEAVETGGYGRIGGYERYDGHASPSDASFSLLTFTTFTNTPAVGQTIVNAGLTASGYVIAVDQSVRYVAYTMSTGTFAVNDVIQVGMTVIGTCTSTGYPLLPSVSATYQALAADAYRALISAPTGSGAVRGVFVLNDTVYCLRNNAGGTAKNLWKATGAGWTQVTLDKQVSFTAGAVATPADGATLTQGGVTATVKRVVLQTGAWTGAGTGRLVIGTPSGGNFAAGAATLTGGATCTLSGVQTDITLAAGGHCDFVEANFTGSSITRRMYCADGVGLAWEFDGTTLVPIATGASPDTPAHVAAHLSYLFLSIGSSAFYSETGLPYRFATGGEIGLGDTVTGFLVQPGAQATGTLAMFTNETTFMLYGTAAASFTRVAFNTGTGARAWSLQNMAQSYAFDTLGVYSLNASLAFGNFTQATLTYKIRPYLSSRTALVAASALDRVKGQYRIFFNDGTGVYITVVNGKLVGCMPVSFPTPVFCAYDHTTTTGVAQKFFGGTDGMVYQLDKGTSFDGANIFAYLSLNWASAKNPRILKRFRAASIEINGTGYIQTNIGYLLGYGVFDIAQPLSLAYAAPFASALWDTFRWDNFYWDGRSLVPTEVDINGVGENIQLVFSNNANTNNPFTVNSVILHYTPLRGRRSNVQ